MIVQRTTDVYCGLYDFAVTGGTIGSYDLQVPVPQNLIVTEFVFTCIDTLISGTLAATVSFDVIDIGVSPPSTFIGFFANARIIGTMTLNNVFCGIAATAQGQIGAGAVKLVSTYSIGMSIGVENITAGKIQFFARGISFDF